jgi:hypothetical protein
MDWILWRDLVKAIFVPLETPRALISTRPTVAAPPRAKTFLAQAPAIP